MGDGTRARIECMGSSTLATTNKLLHLSNVLHVPNIRKNLMPITQFSREIMPILSFTLFTVWLKIFKLRMFCCDVTHMMGFIDFH